MNQAVRRVWIAVVALLVVVLGATTYVQFFAADSLNNNALNNRQLVANYGKPRGAILVDGKPIAESVKNSDGSQFDYRRVYHEPELYSGLTGYYSFASGATQLESSKETTLSGTSDSQFFDRIVNLFTGSSDQGANVALTINPKIQRAAYNAIPDGMKGSVVVSDPKTGKILAMVSKPSYDTNLMAVQSSSQLAQNKANLSNKNNVALNWNPAVFDTVPPGSSFKLLDLVAGLESGDFKVDGEYDNSPNWTPPGTNKKLRNFDHGSCASRPNKAPLKFIVAQSCNTPFAQTIQKIGQDKMNEVTERFGFNSKPQGLGLAPVSKSVWPEKMSDSERAYASIGQFDVKTTALQMNMVAAGIANKGVLMKPQLVEEISNPNLQVLESFKAEKLRDVTSKKVAEDMTELMKQPPLSGTAMRARVPGVDLAAKTGTAQIGDSGRVHAWITGFAPADDPEVAITVNIQDITYQQSDGLTSRIMNKVERAVFDK